MLYTLLRISPQYYPPLSPDQHEAFGPATREELETYLRSIGANPGPYNSDIYFDNSEPGVKYLLAKLKPIG